jgi:hypothetical protein
MGFHLLSGWLLPSLLYLFWRSTGPHRLRQISLGAAALVFPMAGLLAFFHFHGLPIQRLWESSHVGGVGGYGQEIAPLDLGYTWGMANVVLLLCPILSVAPALLVSRRLGTDAVSRFLQIGAASMVAFAFIWRAQLGIFEDWNLFAPGMVVVAILISRSLSAPRQSRVQEAATMALMLSAALHTAIWVVSNHLAVP